MDHTRTKWGIGLGLSYYFAVNAEGDPSINLLIILLTGIILYILLWIFGSAYKHLLVSLQESVFIALSCLLASASLYIRTTTAFDLVSKQTGITLSVLTMAFVLFLVILSYHVCQRIKLLLFDRYFKQEKLFKSLRLVPDQESSVKQISYQNTVKPTVSYVALSDLRPPTND